MPAVHAVALPADFRQGRQGGGIVPLLRAGLLEGKALFQLLQAPGAGHHAADAGAVQGVLEALGGRQGLPRRGEGIAEQIPAAEGLHDGDSHLQPLAGLVELLPLRVHVQKGRGVVLGRPELLHILGSGLKVIAGIHAEHQHIDKPGPHRRQGRLGIVAGKADAADGPRRL